MPSGEQISEIARLANLRLEALRIVTKEEWAKGLAIGQVQEVIRAYYDLRYRFPENQD